MAIETESRKALHELMDLISEVDQRWAGEEWNLLSANDVVGAHRSVMHMLEAGLATMFESDPARPQFRRIVSPWRKLTGDNSDAIYFDAPVSPECEYRVRGSMDGAVYVSLTVEIGTEDGSIASRTGGVINDEGFDLDDNGFFDIRLGGEAADRNWLPLPEGASRITTRHYYEEEESAAKDPNRQPYLIITNRNPPPPPGAPDDATVSAGIRRVAKFVRSRTLDMPPMSQQNEGPPFVSRVPNQFPKPVKPGDFGLAAFDAAYSMAPFLLGPDEALVMTGRWPEDCRFANVCLWNRFQQTLDFSNHTVSLNRVQTELEPDGSFKIVVAHEDPGLPNWLSTQGTALGLVFWRYMLPEGEIETPRTSVVKLAELKGG